SLENEIDERSIEFRQQMLLQKSVVAYFRDSVVDSSDLMWKRSAFRVFDFDEPEFAPVLCDEIYGFERLCRNFAPLDGTQRDEKIEFELAFHPIRIQSASPRRRFSIPRSYRSAY